jgi:hypothetical protein
LAKNYPQWRNWLPTAPYRVRDASANVLENAGAGRSGRKPLLGHAAADLAQREGGVIDPGSVAELDS